MKRKRLGADQSWNVLAVLLILLLLRMCCIIYQLPRPINIAVSYDKRLDFLDSYGNTMKSCNFDNLDIMTYNSKQDSIYLTQVQENTTISRLDINNQKLCSFEPLFSINSKRLSGMAFDSKRNILYFIEKNANAIFYLPPEEKTPIPLIKFNNNEDAHDIALDTCLQYIFWTNNNYEEPTIERAYFNGTNRTIIINSSLRHPMGIAVDEIDKKIYWIDDDFGHSFSISKSNFDGSDRELLLQDIHQRPHAITINQNFIFWTDFQSHSVWKLNKDGSGEKVNISHSQVVERPNSLVAWSEQRLRLESSCPDHPNSVLSHCENGKYWNGSHCEFIVCKDFCMFDGKCSITKDGTPWCQCNPGFVGTRCERDLCYNTCLNGGKCVLRPGPQCDCPEGFKGNRCQININNLSKIENICRFACSYSQLSGFQKLAQLCNCSLDFSSSLPSNASQPLTSSSSEKSEKYFPLKFLSFSMAGILFILIFIIMLLGWRIKVLSRRPRIKKRIIVNKNVTPMSDGGLLRQPANSSTDQCEITIENCCNMNICETPCFEPQFRNPDKSSGSTGKEEKKGLLGNMEEPDLTRPVLHHKRHDDLF